MMKPLVEQVVAEFRAIDRARAVDVTLGPLPDTIGDPAMLRQVWVNLLSNAFKYTRPCPAPAVTIDGWTQNGEQVYRIRDNGVGFDMRYVDKVFTVFQRLHPATEFEGTGVGLALVSRILERHSGRIWADSDVGRGATFQFAMPAAGGAE